MVIGIPLSLPGDIFTNRNRTKNTIMNIYQIPHTSSHKPQTFVSVIDASCSMRPFWPTLARYFNRFVPKQGSITITFDTTPYLIADNILSEDIYKHGGGGTNITAAFELMDQKIAELDKRQSVTVLFISDGQDNNIDSLEHRLQKLRGNQGRMVTFICLGIQSQFPTFISMYLRDLYHNGVSSVPALYLIEYYSDGALFNKFETMKEHFVHKKLLTVKPPVSVLPWNEPQSEVYEDTWVMTSEPRLQVDGHDCLVDSGRTSLEDMLELFRGYVQELQMLSLNKSPKLKEFAQKALEVMKKLMDGFKAKEGLDLAVWIEDADMLKVKFLERCKKHKLRHNQFRLKAYLENVQTLAKGEVVKDMNEWEAAKRLGIGTITGTYQQKALNLKGFTVEMYRGIRNDFRKLFAAAKLDPGTDQEASIITKETQKEVFMEPGFDKGLELCDTQFDLVETLPVVGLALQLKRYVGSINDPWLIGVKFVSNTAIDSIALFQNKFKLPLGEGEEVEHYNGLLPLFGPREEDMYPLVAHSLFHVLMTSLTSQNLDVLFEHSYLALLANTMLFLVQQELSDWRDTLIKRVLMSTLLLYGRNKDFNDYTATLLSAPESAIRYDPTATAGCSDLSKPLGHLMCLKHLGKVGAEETALILQHMYIFFFSRLVDANRHTEYLKVVGDTIADKIKDNIVQSFSKYATLGDLRRDVEQRTSNVSNEVTLCPVVVNLAKLDRLDEKVGIRALNRIHDHFAGKPPTDDDYLFWLYCAIHNQGKRVTLCQRKMEEVRLYFFNLVKKDLMQPSTANIYGGLRDAFIRRFKEEHMYLLPMSFVVLKEHADKAGIDIAKFDYMKEENLVRNACMCPKCPFYLKPQENLRHHLSTWAEKCPKAFHKTVRRNLDKPAAVILDKVLMGELAREKPKKKLALSDFNSSKEEAETYINLLKEEYKKIVSEEAKYPEELKALENKCAARAQRHHRGGKKAHKKYPHDKEEEKDKGGRGRGGPVRAQRGGGGARARSRGRGRGMGRGRAAAP